LLDGIYLEKEGIPTAVISTEPFEEQCKTIVSAHHYYDYEFVQISHPIANALSENLLQEARRVKDEVINLLLGKNT
jgi:hypothetical protein